MEQEALYVRDGDAFVGTILTQGGWDPDGANGGAVLALLGHCLDEVPTLAPMSLSRFTADLVRPVPIGRRLRVHPTVLREGKKIQLVQLVLVVDEVEHVRATALRLREADLSAAEVPPSSTDASPPALVPPHAAVDVATVAPTAPGFLRGMDLRRAPTADGTATGYWLRLRAPVVAGEPISPAARAAATFDFANLVGVETHSAAVTLINPDVTAHVLRPPVGDWIAVTGATRFRPELGRGLSSAELSDDDGLFAIASTSQLIQPRG